MLKTTSELGYDQRMGAWGTELLENDTAADEIGILISRVVTAAVGAATGELSPKGAGVFAAQLALIARYAPDRFRQGPGYVDEETTEALCGGIEKHRAVLLQVAPGAAKLLDALERGGDLEEMPLASLLGAKHARVYLQELADQSVDEIEDTVDHRSGARLHLLTVIAPYVELPAKTVRHWLRRMRATVNDANEDELEFLRPYMKACKKLVEAASSEDDD